MPEPGLAALAIIVGLVGLIWSADRFVTGSAAIARLAGVSRLVIGLTIVSLGTSAPEIVVAVSAALQNAGELAVGNALGSNIANVGLVLGVTATLVRLPVQNSVVRHELPALLFVTLVSGVTLYDFVLTVGEGLVLCSLLILILGYLVIIKKTGFVPLEVLEDQEQSGLTRKKAIVWFVVGLAVLIGSSELLVWGAKNAAHFFGVSPLVIGLTVIAVGTSLPELATSLLSAWRGHHDLALGNIVGSNIFNLLGVMAIPGLIGSAHMEPAVFFRDYIAMGGLTLLLMGFIGWNSWRDPNKGGTSLGRFAGITFLLCYISYYMALAHLNF